VRLLVVLVSDGESQEDQPLLVSGARKQTDGGLVNPYGTPTVVGSRGGRLSLPSAAMATGQDERYAGALLAFTRTLRRERIRAGLTQTELADKARLSVTMVQNLERPSYAANPRLSTLLALAEALDVHVDALLRA